MRNTFKLLGIAVLGSAVATGVKWKQFIILKKYEVKPLFECNGFCGTNDLNPRVETENEINFDTRDIDEKPFEQQHGSY